MFSGLSPLLSEGAAVFCAVALAGLLSWWQKMLLLPALILTVLGLLAQPRLFIAGTLLAFVLILMVSHRLEVRVGVLLLLVAVVLSVVVAGGPALAVLGGELIACGCGETFFSRGPRYGSWYGADGRLLWLLAMGFAAILAIVFGFYLALIAFVATTVTQALWQHL